jgi:predicted nucleic acid-binding protein
MRKIAIDTNIYAAFKSNHPQVVAKFQNCDIIGVDIAVIAELLAGFKMGNKAAKNRQELEAFLANSRVEIFQHDLDTAEYFANIVSQLKKKGKPIPTNDLWIAANAQKKGYALSSFDKIFNHIEGLLLDTLD